ncbi:MAG TPA: tetratricopeptide repeat protein, partial [Pyrinomonadaceae bacterium]|nr:tetratricopeptide repeat protein [Pyrinomonadaceae bacterium]
CVVGPFGLKEIWTTTRAVYYPLVLTTFWALHKLFGLSPLPYHLLNISFHVASAILLWRILQVLRIRGAWLSAALWALHPVMVQSVAWVTELKNTQSCVFYLLSILFFLKWEDQGGAISGPSQRWTGDRRSLVFALSLLFFLLATLSKTSVVMLPFVLALCVWWMRGRIRWRDTLALAPFALISVVASAWTIWEQRFHARAVGPDWVQTFPERLIIAGKAIWFYLGKLVWPHPLIFIYPRWDVDSSKIVAYLPLLAAIAGFVALWFIRPKRGRALFFAAAYYVVSLFPVLGFFSVYFFRYSFVSDHFQYLASMGPVALIGAGIAILLGRFCVTPTDCVSDPDTVPLSGSSIATPRRRLVLSAGLCGILLVSIGFLTWWQTAEYRDLFALYTATLQKNPDCWMAHYNLGIVLSEQGEADQAIDHYRRAVALRPDYAEAHYNLGRLLVEHGQLTDAIAHYERAAAINPTDAEAQNNLGVTLFGIGRTDDAIAHYQNALEIRPDYGEASCNLANALIAKDDFDGAIARYKACLAAMPDQAEAQYNLASALLRKGRTDEAIVEYQKVLQVHPESADAHANLGIAWLAKGRVRDAMAEYTNALQISPENLAALSNLAWLLATSSDSSLRNGSEAVRLAERADSASSRSDKHPTVLRILAAAHAEAGQFAEAKETAHQALEAANIQGNTALAEALQGELALYDLGLPYHK